ncbi:hypothetical protein L7F22_003456 [Adiantum nelumboides]|nr:hypothetical protein [Adiantum nelumboides]
MSAKGISSQQETTLMGVPFIKWWHSNLEPESVYVVELYFAEIDPTITSTGQRTFTIYANGDLMNIEGEIDVFAKAGANAAYGYSLVFSPNSTGDITFNFTPTATSVYPPFLSAAELFEKKAMTNITSASVGQSAFLSYDPIFCFLHATFENVDAN